MKRHKHSLSHHRLFSCDMGELVPMGCIEVLPGDTIQQATSALVRASPMVAPIMHPVDVRIHHWFVPYRILWLSWEDFITGGPNGTSLPAFPTMTLTSAQVTPGSLLDYLGIPTFPTGTVSVSALPIRAYQLIWSEFYRDQDLQGQPVMFFGDGVDVNTNTSLQHVAWEKDYFTSSRPWEQKGPAITVPIGTSAPVKGIAMSGGNAATAMTGFGTTAAGDFSNTPAWQSSILNTNIGIQAQSTAVVGTGNRPQVFADLTNASAITVTSLRQALALQRFEEARARYGSRYVEYLRALGVRSSDARLQRPEYLGGGRQVIQFSEVVQTAADGTNPVSTLRGHGISALRSNRYRRFFEEHGVVMSLMSIRPKTIYSNGLPRMWSRRAKEDFWQKELEHIGQQKVKNSEVYVTGAAATDGGTFGFQDRYDEYRRLESGIAGEFRTTLNYWHLARDFSALPVLNNVFVSCSPAERAFAVPSADNIYVMAKHSIQARRLVAQSGTSFIF